MLLLQAEYGANHTNHEPILSIEMAAESVLCSVYHFDFMEVTTISDRFSDIPINEDKTYLTAKLAEICQYTKGNHKFMRFYRVRYKQKNSTLQT